MVFGDEMYRWVLVGSVMFALGAGALGYTKFMAEAGTALPPAMVAPALQADAIEVIKSRREMRLLRAGQVIGVYRISLGAAPSGHKMHEGDERTPEGSYQIDWRNPRSVAYLSLHISYPNTEDTVRAEAAGVSPGGNIMIHGLPNGWGFLGGLHRVYDWTDGCIAVTNAEIREIWAYVPNGTPIRIVD